MIDLLKFDFCDIEIYEDYVVVMINEGVTVMPKHNTILINIVDTYFRHREFVYITHRVNSYAVDPSIYLETSKIKNLRVFVVVSKDYKAKANAEVEMLFFNKPFKIFDDFQDAKDWAEASIHA
ncbi:hypothetical protein ES711_14085 [Gelidibacter salicanalis]|uniref:STAS/SEC14 domain-containing protein n=1 Tax=Gelidibacter salicanalis TaxID=291193 RepID=A0A5C7ADJ9_9FLAO|nr:hypothetical protein [Gelidibacter salicanalis]TXE05964.1 hypothetical protein ES711_14085 [Gelidibacter salicanalis]